MKPERPTLPTLTKKSGIYEIGDMEYEKAIKELKGNEFTLFHGGYVRFGMAGLHWTSHESVAKHIGKHTNGKVMAKKFKKTDKFLRVDDGMDQNTIPYYIEQVEGRRGSTRGTVYGQAMKIVKQFMKLEKIDYLEPYEYVSSLAFEINSKEEKLLIKKLYNLLVPMLKSKGLRGLVYFNEFEDKGDSFVTFW